MTTKFTIGNYYKANSREVVYLVTSRTKCFINYKEFWISDLSAGNSYRDGKIKIRIDEDNSEYVLIDGFCEVKSSNNYEYVEVKEVKEEEIKVKIMTFDEVITFDEVKEYAESCGYTLITEEEYAQNSGYNLIMERKNENNLRLSTISGRGQFVQLTDVIKTIREGTLLNKEFTPLPFPMTEDEVKEYAESCGYSNFYGWHGGYILGKEGKDQYSYTLADVMDVINEGRLLSGESCAIAITEEQFFNKVKEYALSCGYILTKLNNEYCQFNVCSNSGRIGQFTKLEGVTEVIKEGRLLTGEVCAWPINSNSHTNSLNNSQGAIVANLKIKNKEEIDKSRKINLKIDGKMVAVNPDDRNLKLTWDPIFGWQLVGADSQELIREPLNPQTKEQPSLKFKTKESAIRFAAKLMAKIKNIKEDRVREYKQRAIKEFMVKVNNA